MELTEDDVLHILKLIDESHFDYFQLEMGELKITVSKGDPIAVAAPQTGAAPAVAPPAPKPAAAPARRGSAPSRKNRDSSRGNAADHRAIARHVLCCAGTRRVAVCQSRRGDHGRYHGRLDRSHEGLQQRARSVKGTIVEVVAQNGSFVEFGQTLFLVKP